MYELLFLVSNIIEFFPLIFLLKCDYSRCSEIFIPLLDFVIIKPLILLISLLIVSLNYWEITLNAFCQNIYTILYFFVISKIYRVLLVQLNNKVFEIGNIIFLMVFLINCYWFDFRYEFLNYATSIVNLIFSIYGIIFFSVSERGINSGRSSNYFWLNIALVTYNMCLFPAMLFDHLIIGKSWSFIAELLWSIVLIASILLNSVLSISFLQVKNVREEVAKK